MAATQQLLSGSASTLQALLHIWEAVDLELGLLALFCAGFYIFRSARVQGEVSRRFFGGSGV